MPTVTKAQRKAYERKLREIVRSLDRVERETLQQSIRLLRDTRNAIAGQLTDSDFSQFRIAQQQQAIDDIIANYEAQARAMSNGAVRQSFTLGERSAVEPLAELGIEGAFLRPSEAQVQVLAQFSADLIGGVGQDALRKINRTIQLNALAGNSQIDAMRDITRVLFGTSRPPSPRTKQPTKGVAYEAERILRTEVNRSYNLAAFAQTEQLAKDVPGVHKQWVATADGRTRDSHLALHGEVQPVNKPFSNGLMYPGDPGGPPEETINCRCRQVSVMPDYEDTTLASQADVDEEIEKRGLTQKFKVADEIAFIDQMANDVFASVRPPPGRAPRGKGEEYRLRRRIVSRIETQMKYRDIARQKLYQYRGQVGTRARWQIDVAQERVRQLDKAVTTMLDIATDPLGVDDWGFASELIDGIIDHTSALRVMAT